MTAHDPGDPACVEHNPATVYTRILHVCEACKLAARKTQFDPREETAAPTRDVPMDLFLAAKDAVYGAMSYVDMEWTAHRPIQGDATPKVIAYWAAAAVLKAQSERTAPQPRCPVHDVPLSGGDQCPTCFEGGSNVGA